jgi:hypothetical protein
LEIFFLKIDDREKKNHQKNDYVSQKKKTKKMMTVYVTVNEGPKKSRVERSVELRSTSSSTLLFFGIFSRPHMC